MDNTENLTLGSLFDGSGGFPLGGVLAGITPVWASEIEPFPIRVTTRRFPDMKHYGDVSKMNGGEIEPVDIITFGSPCTDLSIAGKRSGLEGKHSSLFYEAIRIIKEMRCATDGKYPRWICWENVPGAYSSHEGQDFKAVLEAVIGVVEPGTQVPMPEKNRWPHADVYMGDGWSVAYRTLDAQYWGVPQRRKRIYLVADFAGSCAGQVLFESEGVSGYSAEGFRAWQGTADDALSCAGASGGICLNDQGGIRMDVTQEMTSTLRAESHHPPCVLDTARKAPAAIALENHPADSRVKLSDDEKVQTLTSRMGTGGGNIPLVMDSGLPKTLKIRCGCEGGGKGALIQEDKSATLSCNNDQTVFVPFCKGTRPHSKDEATQWKDGRVANTLNTFDVGEQRCSELVVQAYSIGADQSQGMLSDNPHSGIYEADTARTLDANGGNPGCNQGGIAVVEGEICEAEGNPPAGGDEDSPYIMTTGEYTQISQRTSPTLTARDFKDPNAIINGYSVRRLTPTECARLQGFPDWWCSDLETKAPTEDDLRFWSGVFETYRRTMGSSSKPKSHKQIDKWLRNPYSDAAEYKMWGNGVALPCVWFVLAGIAYFAQNPV